MVFGRLTLAMSPFPLADLRAFLFPFETFRRSVTLSVRGERNANSITKSGLGLLRRHLRDILRNSPANREVPPGDA
jgi:hypothetical protein